jgi:hypothetical protein
MPVPSAQHAIARETGALLTRAKLLTCLKRPLARSSCLNTVCFRAQADIQAPLTAPKPGHSGVGAALSLRFGGGDGGLRFFHRGNSFQKVDYLKNIT